MFYVRKRALHRKLSAIPIDFRSEFESHSAHDKVVACHVSRLGTKYNSFFVVVVVAGIDDDNDEGNGAARVDAMTYVLFFVCVSSVYV